MNRQKFLKLSLYSFIASLVTLVINYFFFHFVTDEGISLTWHEEAGKPFVANMIGTLAVLFIFSSVMCLFISFIFYNKEK